MVVSPLVCRRKRTRRIRRSKVVVVILSLLALPIVAMATPGAGYIFKYSFNRFNRCNPRTRPRHGRSWSVQLNVEGATDSCGRMGCFRHAVSPAGTATQALVLITVKSGAATWYSADNPNCTPIVYATGSAFIELQTSTTILPTRAQTVWSYWTPTSFPKGRRRARSSRNHRGARCDLDR